MNTRLNDLKPIHFLAVIVFFQIVVCLTVILDISVARQVVGFVFFSFIPGFIAVKLLRMAELDKIELILWSVGLSIAFLMFGGLLANQFGFLLGILRPLSLMPLLIGLNGFVLVGGVLVCLRNEQVDLKNSIPQKSSLIALLFICLPILSILGAMWVNLYGNNIILLITLVAVALSFAFAVRSDRPSYLKFYSFAVLMIAIALLLHSVLISRYLINLGSDITTECFVSKVVLNNQYWNYIPLYTADIYSRLNSMLSVTILPTLYSTLLNVDASYVLKILYPLIFSFTPLALYQLWRKNFGNRRAFVAAFFFMAQATFYTEMTGLARQMIGELFFILLLLTTVSEGINPRNRTICFIVFSAALITSHYALAEIFLFFISCVFVSQIVLKRSQRDITASMVILFLAFMFTWYIYTSGSSVFNSFISYGDHIKNQLGDFLNPASRGQTVLIGLGMKGASSIWNSISRVFAYVTEALVAIGVVGLMLKRTGIRLKNVTFIFSLAAVVLLAATLVVPGLANTLNMTRFYHILLFFLAPFCVLGLEVIVKYTPKIDKRIAVSVGLLLVLIPYFLFQTGFIYEVTKSDNWSLPLSIQRMDGYRLYVQLGYVDDFSAYASEWLRTKVSMQRTQFYSDLPSASTLAAYASVYGPSINVVKNSSAAISNMTLFLGPLSIIYKTVVTWDSSFSSDQLFLLNDTNQVYSNGGCEIYAN